MNVWQTIVIMLCAALAVFVVGAEWVRPNKNNRLLRITVNFVALAALACLALNITYERVTTPQGSAIIATGGYSEDSVSSFIHREGGNIPVYTLDEFLTNEDLHYKIVHVFGYGLSSDELQLLRSAAVIFHPQKIATGIVAAHWQQNLHPGDALVVQGTFNNAASSPAKLVLSGFGTTLDSTTLPSQSTTNYSLSAVPKQSGRTVYTLSAMAGNSIIEEELIPVDVTPPDSLKILMLSSSPSFENRFLRNWLSKNGIEVITRSTTSKNKFNTSFLNAPQQNVSEVNAQTLKNIDVLVCDATEFASLNKEEQNNIASQVEAGMGLLLQADTALPATAFFSSSFPIYSAAQQPLRLISLQLAGASPLQNVPGLQPLRIKTTSSSQPLVTDSSGILVNRMAYGAGKIIVTTINNTYSWALAGRSKYYQAYWSLLLSKAAKAKADDAIVSHQPAVPVVHQPVHLHFENSTDPRPVVDSTPVYLQQETLLPYIWHGSYWPRDTGWHNITTQTDTTGLYVYSNRAWPYVKAAENTAATSSYAKGSTAEEPASVTVKEPAPFPKIYFVIILLVCCIFLWVEKKFNG